MRFINKNTDITLIYQILQIILIIYPRNFIYYINFRNSSAFIFYK